MITATGTTLWLRKRQRKGLPSERLAACWIVVVWGMPLLLVLTAWLQASPVVVGGLLRAA